MDWALALLLALLLVGDDVTVSARAERIPNEAANVDRRLMEWWKRGRVLVFCSTSTSCVGITTTVFGENVDVEYGANVNSSSASMEDMNMNMMKWDEALLLNA